ncbi:putative serine protease PRSS22 [Operophtera brumata]|uniref:Putative serine protease PRSS22 n=1 Tax=Operophtera brumata TaxID=104452 RepID=A0A0L7L3T3_OPEBR|nr:putative serine protease PRSS22 [Operophtera brumata]
MKLLILIFLISINYCLSENNNEYGKKIVVNSYPKKVTPGLPLKKQNYQFVKPILTAKKKLADKSYTVFPSVYKDRWDVRDSPNFPMEKLPERIVDSQFIWRSSRSKRAVVPKNKDDGTVTRKTLPKPPLKPGLKGLKVGRRKKLNKPGKRTRPNKNLKRKRRRGKRIAKRSKNLKFRSGPSKNRKHIQKTQNRKKNAARSFKLGNKQARPLSQDRRNFQNMTKSSPKGARRLISGADALIEDYPYVVSIQKEREHWCAGALLNPRLVITTANCLWKGNSISRMHIRAGSKHTDRGGQVAGIQEIMKHPRWNIRSNPDFDVGLVLLDTHIKFSHNLHGVDLPNRMMMPAFEDAWITSWGAERNDGVYNPKSNTLQVYQARLMDREKCNNVTERFGVTVTENFICIQQTAKKAPCTRDTGAPAVSDGVLWGLASWGIRKLYVLKLELNLHDAMFSYIGSPANMDFIINATHYLMADERFNPFLDRSPVMRASSKANKSVPLPAYLIN